MCFELPLAEQRVKRQQVITLHLIVTFVLLATGAFLFLVQYLVNSLSGDSRVTFALTDHAAIYGSIAIGLGLGLLTLCLVRGRWLLNRKVNVAVRVAELALLLFLAVCAFIVGATVPAILYLLVSGAVIFSIYWERIADNTMYVRIDERGIRLPASSRLRALRWEEVEDVILRFGILTVNCCDNRLFQWNINRADINKDEFRRFCEQRLAQSRDKRKAYTW